MDKLKGLRMLFKVQAIVGATAASDGSFRVKRVCMDEAIIELFLNDTEIYSPTKGAALSLSDAAESGEIVGSIEVSQDVDLTSNLIPTPDLNNDETTLFATSSHHAKRSLVKDFNEVSGKR